MLFWLRWWVWFLVPAGDSGSVQWRALLTLAMIDYDNPLLPDALTLPLLWAGLIVNSFEIIVPLQDALWGAIGGYLSLWIVYQVFKIVTGKEGLGYGDFKLLAALGAWLGWMMLLPMIILSSFIGIILAIGFIMVKNQERTEPMPFGSSIAIAGVVTMLWGEKLVASYQQWFGIL